MSSLNIIPHPLTPYVIRAWWTSSIAKEADNSSRPPGSWRLPLAEGRAPVALRAGVYLLARVLVSPGLCPCPFLPGPPPPYSTTSYIPAMARMDRKALSPTTHRKKQLKSDFLSSALFQNISELLSTHITEVLLSGNSFKSIFY